MALPNVVVIKANLDQKGGLEKYTWELVRDICTLGAPVTLLTTGRFTAPFSHPLLRIVCFSISHSLSFMQLLHFDRACFHFLKNHPSPIVFGLDRTRRQTHIRAGNGVHAVYLKHRVKEEGKFKAWSFHLNPLHRVLLGIEKQAFEDPGLQTLFTNSNMVREEILAHYDVSPAKITVVHNGVEWHAMQPAFDNWQENKPHALKKYGLNPSCFQFLFIGHNYKRKGLEKLLIALSTLKDASFQLSVIGKEKDLAYFQQKAHALHLSKQVFFFGPSKDILSFYQLADALIIPSLYDPFANVTVEALAMGLFVISSRTNGGSEVLSKRSGIVIEDLDDPVSFAASLQKALCLPKTENQSLFIRSSVRQLDFSNQLRLITETLTKK